VLYCSLCCKFSSIQITNLICIRGVIQETPRRSGSRKMADNKSAPIDNLHTKNGNFICGVVEGNLEIG